MTEKTVLVTLPVSVAVDAVQLRLQSLADSVRVLAESPEAPAFADLESIYTELFSLAYVMKTVEQKENAQ